MGENPKNSLKRIRPSKNASFCLAPWTHTYLSPQGERRLCCASREKATFVRQYIDQPEFIKSEFVPQPLDAYWNGEHLRSVRRRMMSGELLPECEICSTKTLNLFTYQKYFTERLFPHLSSEAFETTDDDGFTTMKPRSFDYRFLNTCNFKCRMCGAQLSSSWELENRQQNTWSSFSEPWMLSENKAKIQSFQENTAKQEFEQAIIEKRIEEIYWVGGEPLLWEQHWNCMERLILNGHARNVHVRYNTNLSKIKWKDLHLFDDILPHFKSYNVCASIDATGPIGEFIRTGLRWHEWLENFESGVLYKKKRGEDSIVMDLTLTLPGLFGLKELLNHAKRLEVKTYVKLVFAFDPTIVLSPLALPRSLLEPFVDDLISDCQNNLSWRTRDLFEALKDLKSRPTFDESWPNIFRDGLRQGKQEMKRLSLIRRDGEGGRLTLEEIYRARPEILDWWESI